MWTENKQVDPVMLTITRSLDRERNKVRYVFQQQFIGVMKKERKMTSERVRV